MFDRKEHVFDRKCRVFYRKPIVNHTKHTRSSCVLDRKYITTLFFIKLADIGQALRLIAYAEVHNWTLALTLKLALDRHYLRSSTLGRILPYDQAHDEDHQSWV